MRRAILFLAAMVVAMTLGAGVALAVSVSGAFTGTNKNETINGSTSNDRIAGGGGNDTINGRGGKDRLFGDFGNDALKGSSDNDFLNVADNTNGDSVDAGGGTNKCVVDVGDIIDPSGINHPVVIGDNGTTQGSCTTVTVVQ
jgi:Ca2+-binding RTX toxin-like protein